MRYRILIQERGKKDKHIAHISIETGDIKSITKRIKNLLSLEIDERRTKFIEFLMQKKSSFIQELIKEIPDDLIDWKSKGKDISKEEFLENEMWFEMNT